MSKLIDRLKSLRSPAIDLYLDCFPEQLEMLRDSGDFVSVCCSRRAGKSEGIARLMLEEAQKHPCLYFTTTRKEAKRIIWQRLKDVVEANNLAGYEFREAELIVRYKARDRIYLTGCNNETEIGKMRGSGWGLVVGDESQLFPNYIESLVEQTLVPATADYAGRIFLLGTPGPVPVGYFYDTTRSPGWSHHSWNATVNPHLETPWRKLLAKTLERRGITQEHPSIQREFFGRWAFDSQALVFAQPQVWTELPKLTEFVVGVDLGFDDADAICVLGWHPKSPGLYLVHEDVMSKQSISGLATKLQAVSSKYSPIAIVADTGALGKKIVDEIRKRTGLNIEAADKARKLEHIELLNDALRSGRFFAPPKSRFAEDAMKIEWDRSNPEVPKVSDRFHSDISDSVLYSFRRAQHWLYEPPPEIGPGVDPLEQEDLRREMLAAVARGEIDESELDGMEIG